ncbi:ABC-three component system middle component 4 [Pseudomonas iridis]|jgi:hypothetical protein|uniref:ABC-three component system middle component 4 n=1 Tax=Pseudomonas iridis TaxID=2710587 RepID=UPI00382760E8
MSLELPYISIDDDFSLNFSILILLISKLALTSKNTAILDFEKIQIFFYLVKNPAKINSILRLAGKKFAPIDSRYTYTIESLSTNVDILFDRTKLKFLLKELAARGMLACDKGDSNKSVKYLLSDRGDEFAKQLLLNSDKKSEYFSAAADVINSLSSLQSQTNSKLNSFLNATFKRT